MLLGICIIFGVLAVFDREHTTAAWTAQISTIADTQLHIANRYISFDRLIFTVSASPYIRRSDVVGIEHITTLPCWRQAHLFICCGNLNIFCAEVIRRQRISTIHAQQLKWSFIWRHTDAIVNHKKCNIAVWYQTGWLKTGNIPVKYSQRAHKRMNKFQIIQQNYIILSIV